MSTGGMWSEGGAGTLDLDGQELDLPFPEALDGVQEAFLTSSLRGVMPLAEVLQAAPDGPAFGELTIRIKTTYDALVAKESGTE